MNFQIKSGSRILIGLLLYFGIVAVLYVKSGEIYPEGINTIFNVKKNKFSQWSDSHTEDSATGIQVADLTDEPVQDLTTGIPVEGENIGANVDENSETTAEGESTIDTEPLIAGKTKTVVSPIDENVSLRKPLPVIVRTGSPEYAPITSLGPDGFVVQIGSRQSEEGLSELVSELWPQIAGDFYFYRSTGQDVEWYVALNGIYSDHDSAEQAIAAMPEAIQKGLPIIRRVKTIQKNLL